MIKNLTKIPKYDGYQRVLGSIAYKYFDKMPSVHVNKFTPTHTKTGINNNSKKQ